MWPKTHPTPVPVPIHPFASRILSLILWSGIVPDWKFLLPEILSLILFLQFLTGNFSGGGFLPSQYTATVVLDRKFLSSGFSHTLHVVYFWRDERFGTSTLRATDYLPIV